MEKEEDNKLSIGRILLTQVGMELALVCQVPGVNGFVDSVKDKWRKYLLEGKDIKQGALMSFVVGLHK